jgi:hypothetical protein
MLAVSRLLTTSNDLENNRSDRPLHFGMVREEVGRHRFTLRPGALSPAADVRPLPK